MSELHGAAAAYVTDALEPTEREEFEAHAAECGACRREVAEFSEVTADLSVLAAAPPPPALRAAVLDAVRPEQQRRTQRSERQAPASATVLRPSEVADARRRVDEVSARRQLRARRWLTAAVAAALVVALALGGWVYQLSAERNSQVAEARLETELLTAPDAKVISTKLANGSSASFVVSKQLDRAMFVSDDLADPGRGRTYQLWTLTAASEIRPDNLIEGGGLRRQLFRGPIRDAASLAISIEPSGGSPQPTKDQILANPKI
jgi:anti-sigma-K factor RskA